MGFRVLGLGPAAAQAWRAQGLRAQAYETKGAIRALRTKGPNRFEGFRTLGFRV